MAAPINFEAGLIVICSAGHAYETYLDAIDSGKYVIRMPNGRSTYTGIERDTNKDDSVLLYYPKAARRDLRYITRLIPSDTTVHLYSVHNDALKG